MVIQPEKVFYAKSVGLNLIPGTHVMEGENESIMLSSEFHICTWYVHVHTCMHAHTHTENK